MLSDSKIRNAKPKDRQYKLYDNLGLFILITPKGGKWWRYRYRLDGREKTLSLGVYNPRNLRTHVSLQEARDKRDVLAKQLKAGTDPSVERKQAAGGTFAWAMEEWISRRNWTANTVEQNRGRLDSYVVPYMGQKPLAEIDATLILQTLRRIEAAGKISTMHRVKNLISRVLAYAVAVGAIPMNPAAGIGEDALTPRNEKNFARLTNTKAIGGLVRAIEGYKGSEVTRLALQWSMLTFCRPGEVRAAEWGEIEEDSRLWRIPAERMKARREHIVPLSDKALEILHELRPLTGSGTYLFPSVRSASRPMSENTVNAALRRMGYKRDEMTAHGFRGMASTQLHELGWDSLVIELQLAHKDRNQTRAAYNSSERLAERRKMMEQWGSYVSGMLAGSNVVAIRGN